MFRFGVFKSPLFEAAGEGGTGGGAGAGAGESGLTEAQLAAVGKIVNDSVGKIVDEKINGTVSRLEKENKKQFGTLQTALEALTLKFPEPAKDKKDDNAGEGDDPKYNSLKLQFDTTTKSLRTELDQVKKEKEQEKKEKEELARQSGLRTILSSQELGIGTKAQQEAAFAILFPRMTRAEDGTLVIGDLTAEQFVKELVKDPQYSFLLAPVNRGGGGNSGGTAARTGTFDGDDIKPGMSEETMSKAMDALRKALPK